MDEVISELGLAAEHEMELLYQQGLKDCVWLLKILGVLSIPPIKIVNRRLVFLSCHYAVENGEQDKNNPAHRFHLLLFTAKDRYSDSVPEGVTRC